MHHSILATAATLGLLAPLAWSLAPAGHAEPTTIESAARGVAIADEDDAVHKHDSIEQEYHRQLEKLERALDKALDREREAFAKKRARLEKKFDRERHAANPRHDEAAETREIEVRICGKDEDLELEREDGRLAETLVELEGLHEGQDGDEDGEVIRHLLRWSGDGGPEKLEDLGVIDLRAQLQEALADVDVDLAFAPQSDEEECGEECEVDTLLRELDGTVGIGSGSGGEFGGRVRTFALPDGKGAIVVRVDVDDDGEEGERIEKKVVVMAPGKGALGHDCVAPGKGHGVWKSKDGECEVSFGNEGYEFVFVGDDEHDFFKGSPPRHAGCDDRRGDDHPGCKCDGCQDCNGRHEHGERGPKSGRGFFGPPDFPRRLGARGGDAFFLGNDRGECDGKGRECGGEPGRPAAPHRPHTSRGMPDLPGMPPLPPKPDMPGRNVTHDFASFTPGAGEMAELQALMAEMRGELAELRTALRELRHDMKSLAKNGGRR